ncbi:MAG: hypothetical protein P1U56_20430 [Saprospiraceae bacterium]|nr:hypothetical protein [Saprospiraceae bacterium]
MNVEFDTDIGCDLYGWVCNFSKKIGMIGKDEGDYFLGFWRKVYFGEDQFDVM